ncbi:MAG: hypothetical protein WA156_13170, partial [Methylocystis silviterrae]
MVGRVSIGTADCDVANALCSAPRSRGFAASGRTCGLLILGANKAALDLEGAVIVDADKYSGARDFGRIVDGRSLVNRRNLLFEFRELAVDLLGKIFFALVFVRQSVIFGERGVVTRLLLLRDRRVACRQPPQPIRVAIGKIDRDLRPLPAFGAQRVGRFREFFPRKAIKQRHILQPAAMILLEEIAKDNPARRLIGFNADEDRALVARLHRAFGQQTPDRVGLLDVRTVESLPNFLLPRMVVGDAYGHELLEAQFFGDVKVEQLLARRCEFQSLSHHRRANEKPRGDLINRDALILQILERPKLIERMQRLPHCVLGERILLLDPVGFHDARNGRVFREALLLDERFKRRETSPARADRELPCFGAPVVQHGPHAQRLQQSTPYDILGQILDTHPRL